MATRIDWFRAMAGVPVGITIDPTFSAKDQQAALMFSANRSISHTPDMNWNPLHGGGRRSRRQINIRYGFATHPGCMMAYMLDWGKQ